MVCGLAVFVCELVRLVLMPSVTNYRSRVHVKSPEGLICSFYNQQIFDPCTVGANFDHTSWALIIGSANAIIHLLQIK